MYDNKDIFFVDAETIVIKIPDLAKIDLTDNRVVLVEVSINDGVDWTTDEAAFTFKPTPQIVSLSHYTTNLKADFALQVFGFQFDDNMDYCLFGNTLTSLGKHTKPSNRFFSSFHQFNSDKLRICTTSRKS